MSFNSNRICLIQIAMESISFKCCYGIDFIIQKSPRGVIIIPCFNLSHDLYPYQLALRYGEFFFPTQSNMMF